MSLERALIHHVTAFSSTMSLLSHPPCHCFLIHHVTAFSSTMSLLSHPPWHCFLFVRQIGDQCIPVLCDISDVEDIKRKLTAAGDIDLVVNNAGIAYLTPFLDTNPDEWDQVRALSSCSQVQPNRSPCPPSCRLKQIFFFYSPLPLFSSAANHSPILSSLLRLLCRHVMQRLTRTPPLVVEQSIQFQHVYCWWR
jgi:hypothetical protein